MYWELNEEGFHLYGKSVQELREVLASLEEHLKPPTEAETALFATWADYLARTGHPVITDGSGEMIGVAFPS